MALWDIETWYELKKLAEDVPTAGVWIQGMTPTTYPTHRLVTDSHLACLADKTCAIETKT